MLKRKKKKSVVEKCDTTGEVIYMLLPLVLHLSILFYLLSKLVYLLISCYLDRRLILCMEVKAADIRLLSWLIHRAGSSGNSDNKRVN